MLIGLKMNIAIINIMLQLFLDIIQMNIENDHNPIGNLYNILCKNLVMVSIFQHY